MATKAWNVGAWAADAEEEEERVKEEKKYSVAKVKEEEAFPSLGEAQKQTRGKKDKKKKGTTVSLSEFTTGVYVGPGGKKSAVPSDGKLTMEEMMALPRGPRERDESEDTGGALGGGFKGYGGFRGGADGGRDREGGGRDRDSGFGRDRDRDRGGFGGDKEDMGPSRADSVSDWGSTKKFVPSAPGGGRDRYDDRERDDDRRGGFGGPSRADDAGTWGSTKKFVPSSEPQRRGGGFDDDRRSGYDGGSSKADEVDNWGAAKKFVPSGDRGDRSDRRGFDAPRRDGMDGDRWSRSEFSSSRETSRPAGERPRLVLQKRTTPVEPAAPVSSATASEVDKPKSNPFGAAKPREEVLKEKGQDWKKLDAEFESKEKAGSRSGTASLETSRPQTPDKAEVAPPARPKANPFGDARPREVLLEEKGKDWRKIDLELEHRVVDRPETEEESKLKEEIAALRAKLEAKPQAEANGVAEEGEEEAEEEKKEAAGEDGAKPAMSFKDKLAESLRKEQAGKELTEEQKKELTQELQALEKKLAILTLELDDKIRFAQKADSARGRSDSRGEGGAGSRGVSASGSDGGGRPGGGDDWGRRNGDGPRSERFGDRGTRGGGYEDQGARRGGGGW